MQVEHRITIATPPATIFQIYEDVENWHTWDPDTKQAFIDGPFRVGSRGRITPPKGMSVPMLFTQVEPGRCFTVESKIPLFRMLFEHELIAIAGATEVIHRVTFSGLLSIVLGPMLSKQLNAGLPITLRNLKALAEAKSAN
ncbi:SRPBCC family protein [Undibacterium flavidum]|uniref:SRPBCC family protein n=1 Tax=Undibacterium flavidum TaxID=2762297 RepID=A0ABR6Y7K1_9BURK|nr:SRPBCC family protein [Undibacterium flavidum]MBC3872582.1 SRPBCC family protein [Undibacterium flavidum]